MQLSILKITIMTRSSRKGKGKGRGKGLKTPDTDWVIKWVIVDSAQWSVVVGGMKRPPRQS